MSPCDVHVLSNDSNYRSSVHLLPFLVSGGFSGKKREKKMSEIGQDDEGNDLTE